MEIVARAEKKFTA